MFNKLPFIAVGVKQMVSQFVWKVTKWDGAQFFHKMAPEFSYSRSRRFQFAKLQLDQ